MREDDKKMTKIRTMNTITKTEDLTLDYTQQSSEM